MNGLTWAAREWRRFVFFVLAIAVNSTIAAAQTPPDSVRRDTMRVRVPIPSTVDSAALRERARQDSIRARRLVDTIKAPMARFESPPDYETESRLRLDRQEILSSGAMYLADLLDRVPGVTSFRSGWLAGIHTSAYRGDFRRLRIFVDGVEFDAIGARNNGVVDQVEIPLWLLDAIEIERTPTEVRVWCRSITVRRTTPYTRVDIFTGDLNTNGFRGIFMRRFDNGLAFQVGGQQMSTQRGRIQLGSGTSGAGAAGDGDQQVYNARIGWAGRRFSIDGYATAITHRRDRIEPLEDNAELPMYQGTRRDGYVRVAYGDTAGGPWALAMVSSTRARLEGVPDEGDVVGAVDTARADTVRTRAQTVVGAGWSNRSLSVSVVDRIRGIAGGYDHSPALRASYNRRLFSVGAYAERSIIDSTGRADVFARIRPTSWSAVTISQSARSPDDTTIHLAENGTLAEAAVRVAGRWIGAGILRQGESVTASPVLLGTSAGDSPIPPSLGTTFSLRGPLYKALRVDMQGVRWNRAVVARPQTQVYTELRLASEWRSRFPRGQFSIDARIRHEWRSPVAFVYGDTTGNVIRQTERAQLINGFLEIRIQQATLFYQYRNLTGAAYMQIPGIPMPPAVQLYGVRWEFWN